MQVLQDRRDRLAPGAATAISIGVFDGVHLGHQHVLRQLRADAERLVSDCLVHLHQAREG